MIPTTSKKFQKIRDVKVTYPGWFTMELPNEAAVVRETYSFIKIMQLISPNYNWENGVKQIQITEKNLSQRCILCPLLRTKILASGSKCIKHFSLLLPLFALYLLSRSDLFNMSSLSSISLISSLDILCCNPLKLKNEITKIEHIWNRKKIFGSPSKILKNISWPINICLKYFMPPTKTLQPSLLHT